MLRSMRLRPGHSELLAERASRRALDDDRRRVRARRATMASIVLAGTEHVVPVIDRLYLFVAVLDREPNFSG
jgi:hypothetical protein